MKSDYAAVTEQSGLFAGKDGFEIKVKKNTDLNEAVIASKSDDNTLSTGTLTHQDIRNHAEYSASSICGGFSLLIQNGISYLDQDASVNCTYPTEQKS